MGTYIRTYVRTYKHQLTYIHTHTYMHRAGESRNRPCLEQARASVRTLYVRVPWYPYPGTRRVKYPRQSIRVPRLGYPYPYRVREGALDFETQKKTENVFW